MWVYGIFKTSEMEVIKTWRVIKTSGNSGLRTVAQGLPDQVTVSEGRAMLAFREGSAGMESPLNQQ